MKKIILLIFVFLNCVAHGQSVKSYDIKVEFFPKNAEIYGHKVDSKTFMRAVTEIDLIGNSNESLSFYLHNELRIDSIKSNGEKVDFEKQKVMYRYNYSEMAKEVNLKTSSIHNNRIKVYYSGFFSPNRSRSLSDYMRINQYEGVFLRAYGYSLWFPVFAGSNGKSYKADFKKIKIDLPKEFRVVVCGNLIEEKIENDRSISIWQPGKIDVSNVQCTAQKYSMNEKKNIKVYYLNNRESSQKILDYVLKLKKVYSENLIEVSESDPIYIIEMPKYGNISSSNTVGVSSDIFNNFEEGLRSKFMIAHELVHPYVQLPVAESNPFSAFVIEGFPSFFQVYALSKTLENSKYNKDDHLIRIEKSYLKKKKTGLSRRGRKLPKEKPILEINYDEIGMYKDTFILNDRVWLFFNDIWNQLGDKKFDQFLRELFKFQSIDYKNFESLILKYLPDYETKLNIWLNTTDYPDELRIKE